MFLVEEEDSSGEPLFGNRVGDEVTQLPSSSKHPATSSQRPAASSPQPTTNSSSSQHPAPSSRGQSASEQQSPTSTSTQPATNSHLTHQPSPVTHLHGRTQHRHHTAPHCTTACTALRTRKPYRSFESFLFEPSIGIFLFYFFQDHYGKSARLEQNERALYFSNSQISYRAPD